MASCAPDTTDLTGDQELTGHAGGESLTNQIQDLSVEETSAASIMELIEAAKDSLGKQNRCQRRILRYLWPNTISNEGFTEVRVRRQSLPESNTQKTVEGNITCLPPESLYDGPQKKRFSQEKLEENRGEEDEGESLGLEPPGTSFSRSTSVVNSGGYEMAIAFNPEKDLHKDSVNCKKNPGHTKFIPCRNFSMDDLPEGWKDQKILDFIKTRIIVRTVRLQVPLVSKNRPKGAFLYNVRGRKFAHTATGWMAAIHKMSVANGDSSCLCTSCQTSPEGGETEWFRIRIETARHVVHDLSEAVETTVEIGYEDDDKRDEVVKLKPYNVVEFQDFKRDNILLECAAHQLSMYEEFKNSHKARCYMSSCEGPPLAVVVSHPHGCCKMVSVGFVQGEEEVPDRPEGFQCKLYTYNTATCPGSSGAPVWIVGADGNSNTLFPHSGHDLGGSGFNKSGPAYVMPAVTNAAAPKPSQLQASSGLPSESEEKFPPACQNVLDSQRKLNGLQESYNFNLCTLTEGLENKNMAVIGEIGPKMGKIKIEMDAARRQLERSYDDMVKADYDVILKEIGGEGWARYESLRDGLLQEQKSLVTVMSTLMTSLTQMGVL